MREIEEEPYTMLREPSIL